MARDTERPDEQSSLSRFNRRRFLIGGGKVGIAGAALAATGSIVRALPASGQAPAAAGTATAAASSAELDTVFGWLPPPAATPGSLLLVDTLDVSNDTLVALAIAQGLANTRMPRGGQAAYLVIPPISNCYSEGTINLWPTIYGQQLGITSSTGTPADVVNLAKGRGVTEYLIWDPAQTATINVANTLAWLHGTAAFSPTDAATSLTDGLTLSLDLRTLAFASAADAYQWALAELAHHAPRSLALMSDGGPDAYTTGSLVWTPRDYAVHAQAFTWIADLGEMAFAGQADAALIDSILASVGQSPSTMFGWSNNESAQTILSSQTGLNFVGADTPGLPAENLSVHNAIRVPAVQRPRPAPPALETDVVYACVMFTDGDNISVLIQYHESRWEDPDRGQVPVGWSMQGMASSWTPGIAHYYFESATDNDEMIAWLPFGYPDLVSFVGKPHWPVWVSSAQSAMASANLTVSQNLPHLSGIYGEEASGWWDLLHGQNPPDGHIFGYTGPVGPYPVGEALWINERPILPVSGGTGSTPSEQAASGVSSTISTNSARPLFVMTALQNCTTYQDAIDTVQSSFDAPVKFVLPGQLIALQREAWLRGLAGSTLLGLVTTVSADGYFLPDGDQDSEVLFLNESGTFTTARQTTDGGSWLYQFNTEGCRSAILSFSAIGQGTVEVSPNGQHWTTVATTDAPSGSYTEVTADVSSPLPSPHLLVRLTAGSEATFTGIYLRLVYNGPHQATTSEVKPLPSGATLVNYPSLTANQATTVPPLDGSVTGQWQTASSITVTPSDPTVEQFGMVWDVPPPGGTVSALWDADHLYILAQVTDSNIMAPDISGGAGAPWVDDGVAIYLSYASWGFKVAATVPTASGDSLIYYQDGTSTSTSGNGNPDTSAAQIGYLQTTTGYNLAMAIPWNELQGFTGAVGTKLRFTPLIMDRQGASTSDWGQIMWCGNDDNPQINGYLILGS